MVKEAGYKPLDMKTWARTPYYNYYAHGSKGMCAMTADIDISALAKKVGQDNRAAYVLMKEKEYGDFFEDVISKAKKEHSNE